MNLHKNARLTPLRREEMVLCIIEVGFSKARAARVYGVSPKIVARWNIEDAARFGLAAHGSATWS